MCNDIHFFRFSLFIPLQFLLIFRSVVGISKLVDIFLQSISFNEDVNDDGNIRCLDQFFLIHLVATSQQLQ